MAAESDMRKEVSSHQRARRALRAVGNAAFRVLDRTLPHAGWADRMICRYRFWRSNGRLPRPVSQHKATYNDLIFARMAAGNWTPLERACIDKEYAKLIASALCPAVKTIPTRRVFHLARPRDAKEAAGYLLARAGSALVAKPTHGSGTVLFLRRSPPPGEIARFCGTAAASYYETSRESQYLGLERKIIVEDDLAPEQGPPADYKFFCSHGEILFCQVDVDRFSKHRRLLVGAEFEPLAVTLSHAPPEVAPPRPANFAEMARTAQALSRLFTFVRVDLYSSGDAVYFGELTFAPEGGAGVLSSEEFGIRIMKRIRACRGRHEENNHD